MAKGALPRSGTSMSMASSVDGSVRIGGLDGSLPAVPTSTTKALMMSLAVPRVYRVYIPAKEEPAKSVTSQASSTQKSEGDSKKSSLRRTESPMEPTVSASEPPASTKSSESIRSTTGTVPEDSKEDSKPIRVVNIQNQRNDSESIREHDIGYVENEEGGDSATTGQGRSNSIVEHVVTAEEMAAVVKIDENIKDEKGDDDKEPEHRRVATDSSAALSNTAKIIVDASEAIKNFFGVMNKNQESIPTVYMSREEAVAAIKRYDPATSSSRGLLSDQPDSHEPPEEPALNNQVPNTEIRLEALLRLTIRNLYTENHFYNAPIYTSIQSRLHDEEPDDWIELTVMVKSPSIGTILERLERIGVGSSVGTISIFKAELCRTCDIVQEAAPIKDDSKTTASGTGNNAVSSRDGDDAAERVANMEAARAEWKNAASRLRVEQVKEQIHEQAQLSLDYLALLTIASILAGIGLITDNAVVIVASMLVSPIMGPVMGMTFGSRVLDWSLAIQSVWHEFVSLLLAVLIGALIGLGSSWSPTADDWPTPEMSSRGDNTGLVTGIAIAIPSGMGVALSILGNNTSSLVGVAISASLLPPAVNAGICWVHAILIRAGSIETPDSNEDFALIGGISFALTMLNIVCIWVSGIIMFHIKEVAPSKSKSAFWSRDIKVARAIQKGSKEVDLEVIKAGLQDAIKKERKEKKRIPLGRRRRRGRMNYTFNMGVNPVDDVAPIVDLEEFTGPTPLTDEVKYYGLEDMATLLGFDEEDEDPSCAQRRVRRFR